MIDILSFSVFVIIHQETLLSPAARTSSSNWPKAPSALPLSSKNAPTAPFPKTAKFGQDLMIYTWNLFGLYFGGWWLNPPKQGLNSNQNKGHLGSWYIYIYTWHIYTSSHQVQLNLFVPKLEWITKRCHISTKLFKWHTIFQTIICWNCPRSNWRNYRN